MKRFSTSLLMLLVAILSFPLSSSAEEFTLTTTQSTIIQADGTSAQNADVVLFGQDLHCSQAKISGGAFTNTLASYEGSPVVITKFDASEILNGKSLKKATLSFDAKCTVSGKNSNVQIASIGTNWDATTATWNNTNTSEILNAVNLNGDGVNVKTSTKTLTQDVTEILSADEDKVIGFAIYTFTGRDQAISNFKLTIEAIDASASSTYTVKFVDGSGNEIKTSDTRSESIGAGIVLTDADKAAVYNEDHTVKYIYVSDDATDKTVAADGSTVITVTFREAATWNYTINAVDGNGTLLKTLKTGTNFEAEIFNVAYGAYINVDGTIYKSSKLGDSGKGYFFSLDLNADNMTKDITFTASDITGVVYFSEGEDIEGLTLSNNNNTFVRSSNGASAYAAEGDVVFTTLPNGKYKITTVICDASKNAGSVWNFKAGEQNIFEFTAGSVNWAEGTSEEFELNAASTDIILVKNGGNNQGVDLIYIIKTGDAELAAPVAASGKMTFDGQPTSNNGNEGDITEDKTLNADEFSITVSPKASGTVNNRFWNNNGTVELRIYNGTLTVKAAAGKTLTKIVLEQGGNKWTNPTANVGTFDGKIWTGEAEEVVFTVTAQCQIKSITVGEFVEPVVDAANIAAFKALAAGTRAKLAVNGAKVTFSKGDNTYIEDETGALLLYQTGLTMTAGKAITGFINGAYTDYKGLAELTAIDVTPASEFTEADTELTATVMTVAEASNVANASKLVKLENVNIDANLQTIKQGEDEIAFYDKFGVMTDYTYPTVAKSIVGIINTNSGYNTFHPVSPDSVVAGEVVVPEVENIAAAKAEDVRGTEIKLNVTGAKITMNAGPELDGSFIEDATGAIMVDRTITNLIGAEVNSATLTGHIVGTVAKDQKRGGIFVMSASANTATASEVTNEATTLEATPTTIAEINAGQVCDVTSKYVVLSNVKFNYSEYGDSKLIDGEEEITFYDVQYMIPDATLSMTESFKSIKGVVTYLNYMGGLTFIPYGEYEAVEKELTKVENIAALKNVADGEYIELTLNNAQVTLFDRGMRGSKIVLEDETAGIQIQDQSVYGGEPIFTELGQTFNGSMVLQYMDQDGLATLIATQASVSDKYTSEVKDVVAKDIAFADAKSENYNMKLVKIANIGIVIETVTIGEGEDAYTTDIPYLTDGNTKVQIADFFSKLDEYYNDEGKLVLPEKCNITGYIMPYPLYDDSWNIIGTTDYFVPTLIEEVAVAEARKWQFDAMGEADEALLAADTEHWTVNKYRYQNTGVAFNNEVIKVNDVELEVTKGLLFTAEAGKLLLGSGVNGSNHFMQVQKGSSFVVTNLAVGDTVRMVVQTSDKTEATVEAPASSVANIIEGFEATKDLHTCTLVMCEAGNLTLKGANHDLRFMSLEVKAGNPNEVANLRKWDFTAWSDETKANLAADAATIVPTEGEDGKLVYPSVTPWRSYEKVGGPTETDPDREGNAYWYGTAIAGSEELVANSVVIAETKGLLFNTVAAGALAIGVNYPSTSLGTYEGPSYLWIGGKDNSFTIPSVKSGSKITLGIESHKNTDARGVKLTINGEEIGSAVPTTYQVFDFTVAGELTDNVLSDVVLTNTNGCHIYFITVDATGKTEDAINEVKAVVKTINNDVYTINGVKVRNAGESLDGLAKGLYIIGGKKVVVK